MPQRLGRDLRDEGLVIARHHDDPRVRHRVPAPILLIVVADLRGALIGYNEAEDRARHTVTDSGIVVVTTDDQPFIGEIDEEALRIEAEFDRRGAQ